MIYQPDCFSDIITDPPHIWIPGDNSPMLIRNILTRNTNNKVIKWSVN